METFYSHYLGSMIQQIQKRTARKLFNDGKTVYLQSSKMRFDNFWQQPADINKSRASYGETFDTICNAYEHYNCDNERGKYAHFFVKC